jgi:hypothetical protein
MQPQLTVARKGVERSDNWRQSITRQTSMGGSGMIRAYARHKAKNTVQNQYNTNRSDTINLKRITEGSGAIWTTILPSSEDRDNGG